VSKKLKKSIIGISITLLTFILSFIFSTQTSLLKPINEKLSPVLYQEREVSEEIIIIGIDDLSEAALENGGLGNFAQWGPENLAIVLENIQNQDPSVIFVDFLLPSLSSQVPISVLQDDLLNSNDFEEFGEEVSTYLTGQSPGETALFEAIDENVIFLKSTSWIKINEEGVTEVIRAVETASFYVQNTISRFVESFSGEGGQLVVNFPVVYDLNPGLEEHASLTLTRYHLSKQSESSVDEKETIGEFIQEGRFYKFDETRNIPTSEGQMLINYAGKSYSYSMISFVDVFYNQIDPDFFKNKIVLIGETSPLRQDNHFTPIDQTVRMPGVEIHANRIQTILDQAFLRYQTPIEVALLLALMLAITAASTLFLPLTLGSAIVALELILYPFFARFMFRQGIILEIIWPIIAVVLLYFTILVFRNVTEFKEKRKIQSAFGHYVSPELVAQISENPDAVKLGGERREMSILFLDIENFTTLSEKLPPNEVVEIINQYFDALTEVIMAHKGTVDKFEGDAIMALFGAPIHYKDHALQACLAAMAIRSKVQQVNKITGQNLNIRVGIATGNCIVGNMGSKQRFDYTAMGDTVNTASRLEGGNKFYGTRVLVSELTMKASQDKLFFRRIDRVRLKGKNEPIDLYQLMGTLQSTTEEGKILVNNWHEALDYYRNQNWTEAEARIRKVMEKLPNDGPAKTYLERIQKLREKPEEGWDGTWTFTQK
jgi:class 3 adenylate cyclase/CHASE2 domain-containing sensor protein